MNMVLRLLEMTKINIKVSFSIKIPTRFEIEFFSVKMTHQPVIHLNPLCLVKEIEKSAERIGNNLQVLAKKLKKEYFGKLL